MTRKEWERVAKTNNALFINIQISCSDQNEHKRRIETRTTDIPNLKLPTWEDVKNREYQPWTIERIFIDTANKSIEVCEIELDEKIKHYLNKSFNY